MTRVNPSLGELEDKHFSYDSSADRKFSDFSGKIAHDR